MTNKDLDHELEKLIETRGYWYTAYGADYKAEEFDFQKLRQKRMSNFKEWLDEKYHCPGCECG